MYASAVRGVSLSAYGRRVTSSRPESSALPTDTSRADRRAPRPSAQPAPVRYEPYLDGLFTYCLSVLCDHESATEALGSVLALAERRRSRCPEAEEERKSWLYALARWTCLRALAEQKRGRRAHRRPAGTPRAPAPTPEAAAVPDPAASPAAEARRRELARLAWPEAAGTTPQQREALELAVRHRLTPRAVAAVLGLEPAGARQLLAAAACEVERTRAALAVVGAGDCATVARLTGAHPVLLSSALRGELVRHVDDCPGCRRAAERAGAAGPWPGAAATPDAALPVVEAPRPSVHVALAHARRSRPPAPRFGRTGFPLDPKDHAARRDRLRARAVTTAVVATVVAAPVIALWAAYRGAPSTGEGRDGSSVTATDADGPGAGAGGPGYDYESAGNARRGSDGGFTGPGRRSGDVSAEVVSVSPGSPAAGALRIEVRSVAGRTAVALTATGDGPVSWSARADAPWLRLSRSLGTLAPGRSTVLYVEVDRTAEPAGPWGARVVFDPAGQAVAVTGHGAGAPSPDRPPPVRPSPVRPSAGPSSGAPGPSPASPPQTSGPVRPGPTQGPATEPAPGPADPTTAPAGGTPPTDPWAEPPTGPSPDGGGPGG
ncbi:sigma-70 family RNA polymerase sigma factor [Streptomyces nitrosporeus]|uniref:Sigma-70 family RNA polymerase sigma factor n=1 Tax=Streptomyces nitrosporeus TaxID=28894 RepID=A0A5J6FCB5_9ACTN|nr:sigma-70 family RNA polymerase sigma factor [Streptomyces nitrosporeus]QEU73831.1 sigma-70 family RNA polymerase sigma factor [Streptomyces nitrosporeus]GGZ28826.1 hypothetical protein GCM10010327_68970 [Streptomyces nitrosporeus]